MYRIPSSTVLAETERVPLGVDLSADGHVLVAGDISGAVLLWDVPSRALDRHPHEPGRTRWIRGNPRWRDRRHSRQGPEHRTLGRRIAGPSRRSDCPRSAGDYANHPRQCHGRYGRAGVRIRHESAFTPDGRYLASSSRTYHDTTVMVWDMTARRPVGERLQVPGQGAAAIQFNVDGAILAVGQSDGVIDLWNFRTGAQTLLTGHSQGISSLAFDSDGSTLASGSSDGTIILWEMAGRRMIGHPLAAHKGGVTDLAFGGASEMLASGGVDGKVLLWDLSEETWREMACELPTGISSDRRSTDTSARARAMSPSARNRTGVAVVALLDNEGGVMRRFLRRLALGVVIVLSAGCGQSGDQSHPQPSTTLPAPVVVPTTDVPNVADALVSEGARCARGTGCKCRA